MNLIRIVFACVWVKRTLFANSLSVKTLIEAITLHLISHHIGWCTDLVRKVSDIKRAQTQTYLDRYVFLADQLMFENPVKWLDWIKTFN